jgi:hypothetical protein
MATMTRREAAAHAARARIAAMTPEQRRQMTAAARAALHARDLAAVDEKARWLSIRLSEEDRERLAAARAADRARAAGRAAQEAFRRRRALAATLRSLAAGREADPALMQMAARR